MKVSFTHGKCSTCVITSAFLVLNSILGNKFVGRAFISNGKCTSNSFVQRSSFQVEKNVASAHVYGSFLLY